MLGNLVRLSETQKTGSLLPDDYWGGPESCVRCGFSPKLPGLLHETDDGFICDNEDGCEERRRYADS